MNLRGFSSEIFKQLYENRKLGEKHITPDGCILPLNCLGHNVPCLGFDIVLDPSIGKTYTTGYFTDCTNNMMQATYTLACVNYCISLLK